jgi:hypothetical protein
MPLAKLAMVMSSRPAITSAMAAATPEDSSPNTTGTLSTVAKRCIAVAPSLGLARVS